MKKRVIALFLVCLIFLGMYQQYKSEALFTEAAIAIGGFIASPAAIAVGASILVAGGVYFATNEDARNAAVHFIKNIGSEVMSLLMDANPSIASTAICMIGNTAWMAAKETMDLMYPVEGEFAYETSQTAVMVDGKEYISGFRSLIKDNVTTIITPSGDIVRTWYVDRTTSRYDGFIEVNGVVTKVLDYVSDNANPDRGIHPYYDYNSLTGELSLKYRYTYGFSTLSNDLYDVNLSARQWYVDGPDRRLLNYGALIGGSVHDLDRDFATSGDTRGVRVLTDYAGATAASVAVDVPMTDVPTEFPDTTTINETADKFKVPALAFADKFPFCIPFDLVKTFQILNSPSVTPYFEIPFNIESLGFNQNIVIDFQQFDKLAVITRWFFSLIFLLGLIVGTRRLIM